MQFCKHTSAYSEVCQYLEEFYQIISYLKSPMAADCEGDQEVTC